MQKVSRNAIVPYSAQSMYDLVNDINAYPHFLPWCAHAEVHDVSETAITASLDLSKGGITKRFTTCNVLTPFERIDMQLVDGPFKHLQGRWDFTPLSETACKIEFQLEFEFTNTIMQMLLNSTFQHATSTMLTAFCDRAKELHEAKAS
jgi:ribosome-associated toxin RatA of RatAB toxin-antitoxin module